LVSGDGFDYDQLGHGNMYVPGGGRLNQDAPADAAKIDIR